LACHVVSSSFRAAYNEGRLTFFSLPERNVKTTVELFLGYVLST